MLFALQGPVPTHDSVQQYNRSVLLWAYADLGVRFPFAQLCFSGAAGGSGGVWVTLGPGAGQKSPLSLLLGRGRGGTAC